MEKKNVSVDACSLRDQVFSGKLQQFFHKKTSRYKLGCPASQ